jgi:hypothetical protein
MPQSEEVLFSENAHQMVHPFFVEVDQKFGGEQAGDFGFASLAIHEVHGLEN